MTFHNTADEVLNIICAQFRHQDRNPDMEKILPAAEELRDDYFPIFWKWWFHMRQQCASQVNVSKYRSVALLIHGLNRKFGADPTKLSDDHWGWIGKFISATRKTAAELEVDFPEPKGRWLGERGQRAQLDAYIAVAGKIKEQ